VKTILLTKPVSETDETAPQAVCLPDSAIVLPGRPLFIPDYVPEFTLLFYPVIRITRLGKCIAPKFAPRYFTGMAPLLRLIPASEAYPGSALLSAGDYLAALGSFSELPDGNSDFAFSFDGSLFNAPFTLCFSAGQMELDKTVATVSKYMTLKNGDLIAPFSVPLTCARKLEPNLRATITLAGVESKFKFK